MPQLKLETDNSFDQIDTVLSQHNGFTEAKTDLFSITASVIAQEASYMRI
mgnify:CR=1 FL=1